MKIKVATCLSCLLAALAIVHGGVTLAAGREAVLAVVSISTGLAALRVIWLAHP